jgi:two-component system, chemotaxis family, CheB/CheR fusion protein
MVEQTRILVVEDDPDGQAVVSHVLQYLRYEIDVAGDADEALAFLVERTGEYRVAIIDLALPGRDGWELLSEIKGTPSTTDLPCIAVTAYHSSKTREDALLAGFTAYFSKPIEATSFARQLEAIV